MTVFLLLSIFLFTSTLIFSFVMFKKHKTSAAVAVVAIGLIVSDLSLVLHLNVQDSFITDDKVSKSIFNVAQMATLNLNYSDLIDIASQKKCLIYFTVLGLLTPLAFVGVVLTFFETAFGRIRFHMSGWSKSVYYFSELNENSLALAKSITKKEKNRCLCIFCGVNPNLESEVFEQGKHAGFIMFSKPETSFIKLSKHNRYYFEISENQDRNLTHAKELVDLFSSKKKKQDFTHLKIFVYSEQPQAPLIIDSINKKGLPVVIINRNAFITNELLFSRPLYSTLEENEKTLSVLLIGSGRTGIEFFKKSIWCGQLGPDYKLEITLMDKDADHVKDILKLECPEFFKGEYKLSFVKTDVTSIDFCQKLDKCTSKTNYVCICLGNDELNIKTAIYLRAYFLRKNINNSQKPFIAVKVGATIKNSCLPEFNSEKNSYNLFAFGGNNIVYSNMIIDSELENLAINVHHIYMQNEKDESVILSDYYKNAMNMRSDRANALHIKYKLFALGYEMQPVYKNSSEVAGETQAENTVPAVSEIFDQKSIQKLAYAEHQRWNAFTRSEGWCRLPLKTVEKSGDKTVSKIPGAKLHACLCSWNELDKVCAFYGKNFKQYDIDFVQSIPKIIGLVEKGTHIGVKYRLVKRGS